MELNLRTIIINSVRLRARERERERRVSVNNGGNGSHVRDSRERTATFTSDRPSHRTPHDHTHSCPCPHRSSSSTSCQPFNPPKKKFFYRRRRRRRVARTFCPNERSDDADRRRPPVNLPSGSARWGGQKFEDTCREPSGPVARVFRGGKGRDSSQSLVVRSTALFGIRIRPGLLSLFDRSIFPV